MCISSNGTDSDFMLALSKNKLKTSEKHDSVVRQITLIFKTESM